MSPTTLSTRKDLDTRGRVPFPTLVLTHGRNHTRVRLDGRVHPGRSRGRRDGRCKDSNRSRDGRVGKNRIRVWTRAVLVKSGKLRRGVRLTWKEVGISGSGHQGRRSDPGVPEHTRTHARTRTHKYKNTKTVSTEDPKTRGLPGVGTLRLLLHSE